ncbi:hypothetical protein [Ruegeria atlantica]|uniref:hypothetical protein n=1 Tax=Ruegeria atlantica TaxID=81569 RepID=UPI00148051ED|nr:hypothetical protein [Ruegeria atlantica]
MNANRIIDMIVRQVMRRLVNKGVDKGFDVASRMGGQPDEHNRAKSNGPRPLQHLKQAQRITRQMRRFTKF